ncbi:clusterin [Nelusetta ayraudi]|uniref:clusterin n=1 Tax=Nelusetta ayraudi TaxID=303726 RepID=UPI003F715DA3
MLMMMMMMKKKKGSLAVVALLVASVSGILQPSETELGQISQQGEKYVDEQVENAVNGVKAMKDVMKKSSVDREKLLHALEKTKEQKEEAMRSAQEKETQLTQEEEVCNETMRALWEECKPCLKNTCVKYYSRTCSSGSGLVGRQLEDVLNRTSPFSIWINGEKMDFLQQEGQRQDKALVNLEEKYTEMADGVDSIVSDSMRVADQGHFGSTGFFLPGFLSPRHVRSIHPIFHNPFQGFQNLFAPMSGMSNSFFSSMDSMMGMDMDLDTDVVPNEDGSVNEDVVITKPFGNGKMTCREIRRNSVGCLKFRNECQKCKDIQHVDCSGTNPLEGPLKREMDQALAMAERFTQQYNSLLRRLEERMANTSLILDMLNREFGWVSSLANRTNTMDNFFQIQTVIGKEPEGEAEAGDTSVSVKLFDFPPMNITVPGDIRWSDPKFSEVVAQNALDRYKESSVVFK